MTYFHGQKSGSIFEALAPGFKSCQAIYMEFVCFPVFTWSSFQRHSGTSLLLRILGNVCARSEFLSNSVLLNKVLTLSSCYFFLNLFVVLDEHK